MLAFKWMVAGSFANAQMDVGKQPVLRSEFFGKILTSTSNVPQQGAHAAQAAPSGERVFCLLRVILPLRPEHVRWRGSFNGNIVYNGWGVYMHSAIVSCK